MTKTALRLQLKEKRRSLPPVSYAEKSQKIAEKLLTLPAYQDAERVLFYVSTPEEVDTHFLIQESLRLGKKVFLPTIRGEQLSIHPLCDFADLTPGSHGILEPCSTELTPPEDMDLIVIPGVGFDARGHRLGHGKGHYDRLLKATRGFKVGLAFQEQLVHELPIEAHDVPMDLILTS